MPLRSHDRRKRLLPRSASVRHSSFAARAKSEEVGREVGTACCSRLVLEPVDHRYDCCNAPFAQTREQPVAAADRRLSSRARWRRHAAPRCSGRAAGCPAGTAAAHLLAVGVSSQSYRAPRLSVRFCRSSVVLQPPENRCRKMCSGGWCRRWRRDLPRRARGARFHVEASFHTGTSTAAAPG